MKKSINTDNKLLKPAPDKSKREGIGIAIRITLLTWIISMMTLIIFILVIFPQQKKMFVRQLESKANSISLSLQDVAAGAAVNEDYASVISAAQTMVEGDPSLDFLLIMKNEGYSLVIEQSGWKVLNKADSYWLNRERKTTGMIQIVPLFNRRVFHFAKPFDYSGIQWGWIHVGLTLDDYDRNLKFLYLNTGIIVVGCILFSLMVSIINARHFVKPILNLRHIVQKVADGDLSVRADKLRNDEIGSLAESVNVMTEALLRKDRILESVRFASQQFMVSSQWKGVIDAVLAKVGQAAGVSRAYIFKNHRNSYGVVLASKCFEWTSEGIKPELDNPVLSDMDYEKVGMAVWRETLSGDKIISGIVRTFNDEIRKILDPQGIISIILIPIFVKDIWWGFLGFDDCVNVRDWSSAEIDSLRAGADMLGATMVRQQYQEALLEAKATLEQRVINRTLELQTQVTEKEKAMKELAEAQSSLVEVSRAAGMAEVATGVLHNVGNVLNSVNVSCTLLLDQLKESRIMNLAKLTEMLKDNLDDLSGFFANDPRGQKVPQYLIALSGALMEERRLMRQESEALQSRVEHIKEIVAMQQNYGRVSGVNETLSAEQLMEDALKINIGGLIRHNISVYRQYEDVPMIIVDKHMVLQILLNLISNAKYACSENNKDEKKINLKITKQGNDHIQIRVEDNGVGISRENLNRIFQHGFTTKKSGHGFGLHSAALAARKLGGSLIVHSDGPGAGAEFTLELPCINGVNNGIKYQ
jgi:two-component system, NtrC family, sensor kinase